MDEQARKALEAAMKLPVSRGGMKEDFLTEADVRGEKAPKPEAGAICAVARSDTAKATPSTGPQLSSPRKFPWAI